MENRIEQSPAWLLIRSSIPAKLAFANVAELFGLTYMQLLTLCLVDSCKEGPAMQGLTAILGCDASNVTGHVDKLVGQGFLQRSESPHDRRAKIITLTLKGEQARGNALHAFSKIGLFDGLTSEEIDTLSHILSKLRLEETPR